MEEVQAQVRELLRNYLDAELPGDDTDLRDYGLDSVDALEFFVELASTFHLRLEDEDLDITQLNTVQTISAFVARKLDLNH